VKSAPLIRSRLWRFTNLFTYLLNVTKIILTRCHIFHLKCTKFKRSERRKEEKRKGREAAGNSWEGEGEGEREWWERG